MPLTTRPWSLRGSLALAMLPALALAGCAGPARTTGDPAASPVAVAAPTSGSGGDSGRMVIELRLRRGAELADSRGALRLFDQDLSVEFRQDGRGPGLEAGEVALDGRPLQRQVNARGAVTYQQGRVEPEGGLQAGDGPWATLTDTGGERVPAASVRVKLAPFPVVTQPTPGQSALRSDELAVVMLPPVPELWYRVTVVGEGDPVSATDLGAGRWWFPAGSLARLAPGRARVLIEVETSCGDCPGGGRMRVSVSSRSELEIPLTLL